MTVEVRINNSSVSFRNLRKHSGIDRFESIRFDTDYRTIVGNESVGLYVDGILEYEGKIIDQSEKEDGIIEVSSIDRTWDLKKRQVPYTEFTYENMEWNRIIKNLLLEFDWISDELLVPTLIDYNSSGWSTSYGAISVTQNTSYKLFGDGSLKLEFDPSNANGVAVFYRSSTYEDLMNYSNYKLQMEYYVSSSDLQNFSYLDLRLYDGNNSYICNIWYRGDFIPDRMATVNFDLNNPNVSTSGVDLSNITNVFLLFDLCGSNTSSYFYINLIGGNIGTNQSTIPYIHFVHDDIQNAIRTTADMVGRYCYIDHENSRFITTKRGEINVSGEVIQKYIGSIEWETEYSDIYNFIYVKGGRENGSAENDYITEFSYDGESFVKYGMSEYKPHVDEELINRSTCKLMADYLRDKYKDPRINGRIRNVPYQSDFIPGYTVNVSGTLHDGEYLIQSVDTDFEDMTCDLVLSNSPVTIENEIRDIKNSIELLKRHVVPLYTDGKPIYVEMETMRRDSSLNISETFNSNFIFGDNFGSLWGGLRKDYDTIHKV